MTTDDDFRDASPPDVRLDAAPGGLGFGKFQQVESANGRFRF